MGSGVERDCCLGGKAQGMNLQSSTLKFDETGEPLHIQQAAQIHGHSAKAWKPQLDTPGRPASQ